MNANDSNDREMERLLEQHFRLRRRQGTSHAGPLGLPGRPAGRAGPQASNGRDPRLGVSGRWDSMGCRRLRPRQLQWSS